MATIRVPYPADPERRRRLFDALLAELARFGRHEGSPERGTFAGKTPLGKIAGRYEADDASNAIRIELTEKPWLVPASVIESQLRLLVEDRLRSLAADA